MNQQITQFRPFYDRVLIRPVADAPPAPGSIEVPDNAKEPPLQGVVLAIGQGRINERGEICIPNAQVGDSVLFGKFAGTDINLDGEKLKIMRDEEIFGALEGDR